MNYEFDRDAVHAVIAKHVAERRRGYICVADGVILDMAHRDAEYRDVVNGSMFSICDSSYVPLYIKAIHGRQVQQYAGSEIFRDVVSSRKYRMMFLGTQQRVLDGLRENLKTWNPEVGDMRFEELPFCDVEDFDYEGIGRMIAEDGADIIWVALGAPKQERFMHRLLPHLEHGVLIAVGAAFKFYSGLEVKRAPDWMVKHHIEFLHRIAKEPRKQLRRCGHILTSLPPILWSEYRKK